MHGSFTSQARYAKQTAIKEAHRRRSLKLMSLPMSDWGQSGNTLYVREPKIQTTPDHSVPFISRKNSTSVSSLCLYTLLRMHPCNASSMSRHVEHLHR